VPRKSAAKFLGFGPACEAANATDLVSRYVADDGPILGVGVVHGHGPTATDDALYLEIVKWYRIAPRFIDVSPLYHVRLPFSSEAPPIGAFTVCDRSRERRQRSVRAKRKAEGFRLRKAALAACTGRLRLQHHRVKGPAGTEMEGSM
jgi:hypothetical protein